MLKVLIKILSILFLFSFVFSVNVELPKNNADDISDSNYKKEVSSDSNVWMELVKQINEYLWFFIGVVAMGVLIYGGIVLFKAEGDENELKKANKMLAYGGVGVIVAISSYFAVRLLTGLF